MVPFFEGKGNPAPETEPIFLAGGHRRVFVITKLIPRQAFHHNFGGDILSQFVSAKEIFI